MKLTILESPYAGMTLDETEKNVAYAKFCMKDSLDRGEAPMVSHVLYTQVLDDNVAEERKQGIEAGLEWARVADQHVFYIDHGMSKGMEAAMKRALENRITIIIRTLSPVTEIITRGKVNVRG